MRVYLDLAIINSESLSGLAYAILRGGPEMHSRRDEMHAFRAATHATDELDGRGRDVSELREMLAHWRTGIEARRRRAS